jgi:hypothetical protein
MTKLDEMWAALAAYQPQADAAGHGETWATMCREKTDAAADAAYYAAYYAAADAVAGAAHNAVYAACYAVYVAVADADAADRWAQRAIARIKKINTPPATPVQPEQDLKEKNND